MKRRRILLLILLLVIGFASISTTLVINGNVNLGFNSDDFDVYFSNVTLNGENKNSEFISSDGKLLNFSTNELSLVGDQAVIYYEVTNASRYYDAEVKLVCEDFNNEYVSVTNVLNASVIESQKTGDGVLISELIKSSVNSQSVNLTCRISAKPVSRESVGTEPTVGGVSTYSLYGYFVDENNEAIPNADLVVYSNNPHYVKTDSRGYFYVDGLEKGSHEIYYLRDVENITSLTKEDIKRLSISNSVFTTSSASVVFKNNAKIKDVVVELTEHRTYNITLKTSTGVLINDNFEVHQNQPYGSLPNVEVVNSSFIHWTLEDGTVVDNDTLVASNEKHSLIAVMSPVVAPTIETNNSNWTTQDVTVSISSPGVAEKGIKNYEYLITSSTNPSSEATPSGVTSGSITVSSVGTNYVYYRTVAEDGVKSSWSNGVVTKIDKTAPTNVYFSNKVVTGDNVTMNVNYIENESGITQTKCYYGDASSQTNNGRVSGSTCVYSPRAEYAKVCVVNSVGKETCSAPKKLADYFFKNGIPQVEFLEYAPDHGTIKTTQGNGYYQVEVGKREGSGRGGIYTKNNYDFSKTAYTYSETEKKMETNGGNTTIEIFLSSFNWFAGVESNRIQLDGAYITQDEKTTFNYPREVKANSNNYSDYSNSGLYIGKNSSSEYATIKIYNIWFQLAN